MPTRLEIAAQCSYASFGNEAFGLHFAVGLGPQAPQPMPEGFPHKKYIRAAITSAISLNQFGFMPSDSTT